ncbi:MAG: TorF family putative porin [Gammaproteobacteria bacterium]|jgi:uncharacterized protein (TIGR02001 family)|nr:TorF family putative porin [Gammaproteobacteria bacterium]
MSRTGWWVAGMLLATQAANAEWSATVTGTSDYDFRGISQTEGDPALQGSVDYAAGLFYGSIWASTIDFGEDVDGDVEVDLVAGLASETERGIRWDVGATYYVYPGSNEDLANGIEESPDYAEIYGGLGYGPLDVKYWWSPDLYDSDETASYLEANLGVDLPAEFGLVIHYGYSFGDYFDLLEDEASADPDYNGDDADYTDFSVGVTRTFGRFDSELKMVTTNTDDYFEVDRGAFRNDTRIIFALSTTFPWSDDE